MVALRASRSSLVRALLVPLAVLAALAVGGCVAYPAYGPGYGGNGYAPGYVYPAPVVVGGGGYYRGGGGYYGGGGGGYYGGGGGWHGGR